MKKSATKTVTKRSRKPRLKVGPSGIQGTGCFAKVRFRKGSIVGEYTGERISHDEADRRYEDVEETYLFIVDEKEVIDARPDKNPVKYINHSCDPNCESDVEGRRVFIKALRTIQPNEELTYDYCLEVDDPKEEPCLCSCGARTCRGTMIAEED